MYDVTLTKGQILNPLSLAIKVTDSNKMPILRNVRINIKDQKIEILGTNLATEIIAWNDIDDSSEVIFTVNGLKLFEIINNFTSDDIKLLIDNNKVTIKNGRSRYMLSTLPEIDFPARQYVNGVSFYINESKLKQLINHTSFAMANADARFYLNGLCLDFIGNNTLNAIATDGHRLSLATSGIRDFTGEKQQVIIANESIQKLSRLLSYNSNRDIKVTLGGNYASFNFGEFECITSTIDGHFPDYNRVIPNNNKYRYITVNTKELFNIIQRVIIIDSESKANLQVLIINLKDNQMILSAKEKSAGEEGEEIIDIEYEDNEKIIGINAKYFLAPLQFCDTQEIEIGFLNENDSIHMRNNKGDVFIIMPVRL